MRTGRQAPQCKHLEIAGVWHKPCSACDEMLPFSAYPKNRSRWDGLHSYCRACNRKKQADERARRGDDYRQMRRRYRSTESGAAAYARYRLNHRTKALAQATVWNAISQGRMTKPETCSQCGSGGIIDGHHDDYAKPLDVRWLCRWCHQEWHRINGEGANAQARD